MYLMRVGATGAERPALRIDDDTYLDLSGHVDDFDEAFFASDGLRRLETLRREDRLTAEPQPLNGRRIGAPIARPHQILCIGLNYRDHAEETGQAVPAEPIVFTKAPNTLIGPNDPVTLPRGSEKSDWEVELGIVIGSRCRYLPDPDAARDAIAGFVVCNDVSERAFQLERGGQWSKGKSCETFNPCGPYLVTPDEIDDVHGLDLWLDVNGEPRQRGNTATMLFDVYHLVHYLSQFMVLEPGDLINTGTPPGVGMGMNPPVFLRPGDVISLGIGALGAQRQEVVHSP
ncbi:fumarylacetoacetate hydrolase family protein [Streptomyces sp. NBC_00038]|uniref:fumarylacetoacetate hydrolase family protein n=1 Tax=Streptomyces sp. NBC_00038 TaxID=2903615 RepID=UPI0022520B15|nr:fumarylacetoacetate hydrolase family protein [Streptomyces sp. NBC_00038]MCX5562579.1 fumarylacetoacetate hydrolase family protein [Streptomyces sp. NBC_00038]